jgi:hypothetical protein
MPADLSEEQRDQIKQSLFAGHKIEAIKLLREFTKLGLADAKTVVEKFEIELRSTSPDKFKSPSASKGCLGGAAALVFVLAICLVAILVSHR